MRSQPIKSIVRILFRRLPLILLFAAIAVVLVAITQDLYREDRAVANSRVGLSSESQWPRHQTNLEAFIASSTSDELLEEVGSELGIEDLEAAGSYVEGVFVVDLDVSAELDADVATASSLIIERAIDAVSEGIDGNAIIELESLQTTLIEVDGELDETEQPFDSLTEVVTNGARVLETDWTFDLQTQWDEDRGNLTELANLRDNLMDRQRTVTTLIDDIERSLLGSRARLFVVQEPQLVAASNGLTTGLVPLVLVGLATAVAAGAIFLSIDRQRGRILDDWQVEELLGLPVLAITDSSEEQSRPKNRRLIQAVASNGDIKRLGVWASEEDGEQSQATFDAVNDLLEPLVDSALGPLSILYLPSSPSEDDVAPMGAEQCDMVVSVVTQSETRMGTLSDRTRALSSIDVPMLGVILAA